MAVELPRILFVERDERLAQLTARYLRLHGFSVTVEQELRHSDIQGPYDCIVLGLGMSFEPALEGHCPIIPFASFQDPDIRASPKELVRRILNVVAGGFPTTG